MANQDSPLTLSNDYLLGRRRFLITSGIGAVGLTLFPFISADASPVFQAVARFARAVGSSVVADLVTDYIRGVPTATAQEVQRTNSAMASIQGARFSDLSGSTVYSSSAENNYFFYAARATESGQIINACVAFFDRTRSQNAQQITLIEGPSLFGIGELSHSVSQRQETTVVRRALLPREGVSIAATRLDRSSNQPDIYRTEAGRVESVYKTDGNGTGEVRVQARSEGGSLLATGTYDLAYQT